MRLEKQEEREMEKLLDEIPIATSPHHDCHHHQQQHHHAIHGIHAGHDSIHHGMPAHGIFRGLYDDSSPFHGFGRAHDDPPLNPHAHGHGNGCGRGDAYGNMYGHACTSPAGSSSSPSGTVSPDPVALAADQLRLLDRLRGMSLSDGNRGAAAVWGPAPPVFANGLIDPSLSLPAHGNAVDGTRFEEDFGASWHSAFPNPSTNLLDDSMSHYSISSRNYYGGELDKISYVAPPSIDAAFSKTNKKWFDVGVDGEALSSPKAPQRVLPKLHCGSPVVNGRPESLPELWSPNSQSPVKNLRSIEAVDCEGSLIIQPKWLQYLGSNKHGRGHAGSNMDSVCVPRFYSSPIESLKYDNLIDIEGYIYYLAKDQHGCRFLQRKFDEGKQQVEKIFNGIIDHVVELMVNAFGNYLMQKLLDVCSEDQRMIIVLMLTKNPAELIRISLNMHGTRAVQKLIDTLRTRQQIALVVSALQPGFLDLIKDLNGNHVLQRCLQSLTTEDNKFIFDAASKHCVEIATHRHGCCVLQRCIDRSTGEYRSKLVAEISANGLLLAQDSFGNYVVQYILELEIPLAIANLASQFEGNYVYLSTQKFSSNVVERCLKVFGEQNRAGIIFELLSVPCFEQLLQDPYANYVIQSALVNSKGSLHTALVDAIRPHAAVLKTNPYCKRIFSRALLKK